MNNIQNINSFNSHLSSAIENDDVGAAKGLLSSKLTYGLKETEITYALSIAVINDSPEIVKEILNCKNFKFTIDKDRVAIVQAVGWGKADALETLLKDDRFQKQAGKAYKHLCVNGPWSGNVGKVSTLLLRTGNVGREAFQKKMAECQDSELKKQLRMSFILS